MFWPVAFLGWWCCMLWVLLVVNVCLLLFFLRIKFISHVSHMQPNCSKWYILLLHNTISWWVVELNLWSACAVQCHRRASYHCWAIPCHLCKLYRETGSSHGGLHQWSVWTSSYWSRAWQKLKPERAYFPWTVNYVCLDIEPRNMNVDDSIPQLLLLEFGQCQSFCHGVSYCIKIMVFLNLCYYPTLFIVHLL